ncbi:MAG: hypothetical protein ACYTFI_01450 [Planctomycetota bacterium]|jgi:hypothetical protein
MPEFDPKTLERLDETKRRLRGGTGVGSVDISSFQGRGTGRPGVLDAQSLTFGGTRSQLFGETSQSELDIVSQFLGRTVTGGQQTELRQRRGLALGSGLLGGAVESDLAGRRQTFVARNRAQSFDKVQELVSGRLNRLTGLAGQFFSQTGAIRQLADIGGSGSIAALAAGGGEEFTNPALATLEALGFGRSARNFVSRGTNQILLNERGEATDEENRISQALTTFFNPQLTADENTAIADRVSRNRAGQAGFVATPMFGATAALSDPRFGRRLQNARASVLAQRRGGAAETLQGAVSGRLGQITGAAGELFGQGRAIQALAQGGREGIGQVADLDASRFSNLFQSLGLL